MKFNFSQEKFLEIAPHVQSGLIDQIERLGKGGLEVLNLVIPKPDIPADIASNYKQVFDFSHFSLSRLF